jgi:type I restriction enzyme, S subunit
MSAWPKMKLGEIVNFFSGYAWKAAQFSDDTSGIPIIRIQNVDVVRNADFAYWVDDYDPRFLIEAGDILLTLSGSFRVEVWQGPKALLNQRIVKITPTAQIDRNWLLHSLRGALAEIEAMGRHALVNNVALSDLRDMQLACPPLDEQKRIAAILDQADELRRKRQRTIDRLSQLGQSIFYEMFGDPVTNPMGWDKTALVDCCAASDDIRCGPFGTQLLKDEFCETGVPLWGIKQVNKRFLIPTHEHVTERKAKELSNYNIIAGDIVMTRKGTIGNCAVYPNDFPSGIMHSDLLRVRIDANKAATHFIADQLHYSRDVSSQIEIISGGAIMQGINVGKLKIVKILLPPVDLQQSYMKRVQSVIEQAAVMKAHLGRFGALFKSLQHRAFLGEL